METETESNQTVRKTFLTRRELLASDGSSVEEITVPALLFSNPKVRREFVRLLTTLETLIAPQLQLPRAWQEAKASGEFVIECSPTEGQPLSQSLQNGISYPYAEVLFLLVESLCALAPLHAQGLPHGEITLHKILLTAARKVLLRGTAIDAFIRYFAFDDSLPDSNETRILAGEMLESAPRNLPPEYLSDGVLDSSGDLYQLGYIAYRLMSGKEPYEEENQLKFIESKLETDPKPISEINPTVPAPISDFIMQLLSRDPRDRFPDALSALLAVQELAQVETVKNDPALQTLLPRIAQILGSVALTPRARIARLPFHLKAALAFALLVAVSSAPAAFFFTSQAPNTSAPAPIAAPIESTETIPQSSLTLEMTPPMSGTLDLWRDRLPEGTEFVRAALPSGVILFSEALPAIRGDVAVNSSGEKIAFIPEQDDGIAIRNLASKETSSFPLTESAPKNLAVAAWIPGKDALLLVGDTAPLAAGEAPTRNLFEFDFATQTFTQRSVAKGKVTEPKISKDGKFIAYTTTEGWPGTDVCILDEQGVTNCPFSGEENWAAPAWGSNQNGELLVSLQTPEITGLYGAKPNGSSPQLLMTFRGAELPSQKANDGAILFTARGVSASTLFIKPAGGGPTPLLSSPTAIRGFIFEENGQ